MLRIARGPGSITLMTVREVLKWLTEDGWQVVRSRGSHRQLKHPTKRGTVTVAGKPGTDMPRGTLASVLRQAGLKRDDDPESPLHGGD